MQQFKSRKKRNKIHRFNQSIDFSFQNVIRFRFENNHLDDEDYKDFLFDLQDFDKDIYNKYIAPGGCFKVVEVDSKIVAIGGLIKVSEGKAEAARIRVHPKFQKKGIGTFLMAELEQYARVSGFKVLWLDTINAEAYNFYSKLKYQLISEEPEGKYICYQFEKRLV